MKVSKVRVEPKTVDIAAVAHNITLRLQDPHRLNDKQTESFI